jgi:hypothetical protein
MQAQFSAMGFSETVRSLPMNEVLQNITRFHGLDFANDHFLGKGLKDAGPTIHGLLRLGLLSPISLEDRLRTQALKTAAFNISKGKWHYTALGKLYGKELAKAVFFNGVQVTYQDFPPDSLRLTPDHHQWPEGHSSYTGFPIIHLQRILDGKSPEFYSNLDPLYTLNLKTRIFSSILEGECMKSATVAGQFIPGCWWIRPGKLLASNKLPVTTHLDSNKILEVHLPHHSYIFFPI